MNLGNGLLSTDLGNELNGHKGGVAEGGRMEYNSPKYALRKELRW